jgi:NAD-dependent DNA ligase
MLASPLPIEIHETLGAFIYRDVSPELVSFGLNVEPQILKIFGLDHIKSVKKFSEYIVLVGYLNTVSKAYYKTGYSNISDQDFDRLLEQLRSMEKEMDYVHPNSPTHKVGSDKTEFGKPVKHTVPMLSLDNSYDPEELLKFMQSIQKQYDKLTIPFEVEWKWDGISLSLEYKNRLNSVNQ